MAYHSIFNYYPLKLFGTLLTLIFLAVIPIKAHSAKILEEKIFNHVAIDQHLKELLEYFVSGYGINARFSDVFLEEEFPLINGQFEDTTGVGFLNKIANLYNLSWYFDGRILHITLGSDQAKTLHQISRERANKLRSVLRSMNAFSGQFNWNYLNQINTLEVYGQPMFLKNVKETLAVVVSTSISADGEQLNLPDPKPTDFIVRSFDLKYASAEDTYHKFRGRNSINLGVVSRLRAIFGIRANATESYVQQLSTFSEEKLAASPRQQVNAIPGFVQLGSNTVPLPPLPLVEANTEKDEDKKAQQTPIKDAKPTPYISHDPINNKIIVFDERRKMPLYERAIAAMDTYSAQIQIEVTILEVSVARLSEIGINWTRGGNGKGFGFQSGSTDGSGISLEKNDLLSGQDASSIVTSNASKMVAKVRALASDGDGQVISQPAVMTIDNTPALIDNTQTFFVRVSSEDAVGLYDVTAGSTLEVKPRILADGEKRQIHLEIQIQDGTVNDQLIGQIPTIKENNINTRAVIEEDTSLIVGGYFFDKKTNGTEGAPGLRNVPLIKYLFSSKKKEHQRRMKMFIISPTIIDKDDKQLSIAREIQSQVQSEKIFTHENVVKPLQHIFD